MEYQLIATSTFGLEAVVKRELQHLGFEILETENGKVTFKADERGIINANLWLRTADRVLLKMGEFKATDFDQLFDRTKALPWGAIIPRNGNFVVNGKSIKSKLSSVPAVQRIVKKAVVESLKNKYKIDWLQEDGPAYPILVSLLKDMVTLTIDTTGDGLHKRGYRVSTVEAPLKETLAAALVQLSYWNKDRILYDLFCGSGTIPIEAAMIGRNIAPGLGRSFIAKDWHIIPENYWKEEIKKAYQAMDYDADLHIFASDISAKNLAAAKENAEEAGVDDCITFDVADFKDVTLEDNYGVLICNPPYGERLLEKEQITALTKQLGRKFRKLPTWSTYYLTSFDDFEEVYNKKANRKRKLYNGRIETWYYQYYGPRPKLEE